MSGISLSPIVASAPSSSLMSDAGGETSSFDFASMLGQVMALPSGMPPLISSDASLIEGVSGELPATTEPRLEAPLGVAPDAYAQLMQAMAQLASAPRGSDRSIRMAEGEEIQERGGVPRLLNLGVNVTAARPAIQHDGAIVAAEREGGLAAENTDTAAMGEASFAAMLQELPQGRDGVEVKVLTSMVTDNMSPVEKPPSVVNQTGLVEVRHQKEQKELVIATPVGRSGWGDELGSKVLVVVRDGQQTAEMQLNPPNLGPLEVRLSVQNDQTSLMFVSAHASVREAIQAALPRLSGMFAESGLSMGSVLVGDQSLAQQQQQQQQQHESATKHPYSTVDAADVDAHAMTIEPTVLTRSTWRLSMFV